MNRKFALFKMAKKSGDTSSLKCLSNPLISGVSGYAKMSVSKQSVLYCEGWRSQPSQLCRNIPLEELGKRRY